MKTVVIDISVLSCFLSLFTDDQPEVTETDKPLMMSPHIIEALGENPATATDVGEAIHNEIAIRWKNFLTKGMGKEATQEMIKKYPIAENCIQLKGPRLNGEIETCLPRQVISHDKFMTMIQDRIANGLTNLGSVMSEIIKNPDGAPFKEILPKLADSTQMLCGVHHTLSIHRRYQVKPYLKGDCKKVIDDCPINEYLFGTELLDRVKANQALTKAGKEMKSYQTSSRFNKNQPGTSFQKTYANRDLNYPRHQNKTRWKGKEMTRNNQKGAQPTREKKNFYTRRR